MTSIPSPNLTEARKTSADDGCPLCASTDTRQVESVRVADIDSEYRRQLDIGVLDEFPLGLHSLSWRHCNSCQLDFFAPMVTGSSVFYELLARTDGYYTSSRWEFDETVRRLPAEPDLIDVGCGDGHFLRRVPGARKRGLEFNPEAVRRARLNGLHVTQDTLESLPDSSAEFLTLFQVLEHVAQPAALVCEAARVLRPGGRLFLSVPNNDAFVGSAIHDPMNAPPHHPLRWRPAALAHLQKVAPLHLESVMAEQLTAEQVYHFRRARFIAALRAISGGRMPLYRVSLGMTAVRRAANVWALVLSRLAPTPPDGGLGPSILAEFRRTAHD
jgi:SAM-dependent methyltransferase